MIWLLVSLASALILIAFYIDKRIRNTWRRRGAPQTDPMPFLGDSYDGVVKGESMNDFLERIYRDNPESRCVGFYQFQMPLLMIRDPELIKRMFVKDFEHFTDHIKMIPEDVDPMWNKNLLSLKGQKWREMRATLSPSFTGSKMRMIFELMHKCAENFAKHFNDIDQDEIEINLKDAFTRYTNDIIATTAFGVECDSLKERDNDFYMMGRQATDLNRKFKSVTFFIGMVFPTLAKFLNVSIFNEETTNFFRGIIKDNIDYRIKNKIERADMLNLLLQAKKNEKSADNDDDEDDDSGRIDHDISLMKGKLDLSLDDITSQALIFFFAGFETVSSAMCFLAYELATNPDIQQKLMEELDAYRATSKNPTYEGLNQLVYFDMVVSETLRKWPVTFATDRVCVKPYTIQPEQPGENPVKIELNDILSIPMLGLHHDPKYWEDPDRFDPERFSTENKNKIIPYTYLPFGIGPRNCIGSRFALIEVKIVFYALLQRFQFVPSAKSQIPYKTRPRSIFYSTDDFYFGLKKR